MAVIKVKRGYRPERLGCQYCGRIGKFPEMYDPDACSHDDLIRDLALKKNTTLMNVGLGQIWGVQAAVYQEYTEHVISTPPDKIMNYCDWKQGKGFTQWADLIDIRPSYTRFNVAIYEIKVKRSDFLSDIRSGKWRGYLDHCHRFYFATPSGLVSRDEIPKEAGLIVRGSKAWKTIKKPPQRDIEIPYDTMMALLFKKSKAFKISV